MFFEVGTLKNLTIFTEKHLFFNKVAGPKTSGEHSRTLWWLRRIRPVEHLWWLLLK